MTVHVAVNIMTLKTINILEYALGRGSLKRALSVATVWVYPVSRARSSRRLSSKRYYNLPVVIPLFIRHKRRPVEVL